MGRDVRKVHPQWIHPVNGQGHPLALLEGYADDLANWLQDKAGWEKGYTYDYRRSMWVPLTENERNAQFDDYFGEMPDKANYMPEWPESERTHLQMYETCSEGTPISPVMPDAESLARWLVANKASAFADSTASYSEWMAMISKGFSVSAVIRDGVWVSGVTACAERAALPDLVERVALPDLSENP
jgi:hypothetical protein